MRRNLFPVALRVELASIFPRWICYVSSPYPHRYFKGFKTHAEMWAWLSKYGYQWDTVSRAGL